MAIDTSFEVKYNWKQHLDIIMFGIFLIDVI